MPCITDSKKESQQTLRELIIAYRRSLESAGANSLYGDIAEVRRMKTEGSEHDFLRRCVCNRHRHQYCLSTAAVDKAVNKLLDRQAAQWSYPEDGFEQLYNDLYALIGNGSTGIGRSTVYDTAIRLGGSMQPQVQPKTYVYVHRHLVQAAKKVLGIKRIKEDYRIPTADFVSREPEFATLNSLEIEDFLCIQFPPENSNKKEK